ncbi:hypothetical protein M441DRAFT_80350 [Trichoderma asperellum CBS 433.97]|uniref:Zn(2)-C6 fungal-type domain-containing protein n=1 Tax=Trichoderma asperellum (strain ATCC 204424 / CBS 433.97 / NBRC 101777) TaxID=1042311 RepID=A0A2T3Z7X1_TRIA4|nr:hypothetical protein M441DRAFT_80350 [Trichoderma asperellum CBS 433.97]PTB40907.1 hypothetical protein M441DRAFT_80350 [Trichoderma asperellum CBS 433.97]
MGPLTPQPRSTSGRTQLACEPCRKRKSKCDGERPLCGNCQAHHFVCHYESARPARRQKYWDRDYVQALEDQVRMLSASLEQSRDAGPLKSSPQTYQLSPSEAASRLPYGPKTLRALSDFSTMKWAAIIGQDGVPVLAGPGRFSIFSKTQLPTFENESQPLRVPKPPAPTETFLLEIESNLSLKQHLKTHFLENLNPFYKFVDPIWLNFSDLFPHNDTALQLLYSALFGAAAYSSPMASRDMAETFISYAESLVQKCYLEHLCLPVLQALIILAWYKHMQLDSAKGNLYHYMAIGLSNHLKIGDATRRNHTANEITTIRTFWSLYFLDRTATPKLGCPSGIPWDIDRVTPYIDTIPPDAVDIVALAFDHHCRLFHIQQQYIDIMYTAGFDSASSAEKQAIFAKANSEMLKFRKQIDKRLYISRSTKAHRVQVVFWISYHSVLTNLQRPLLNPFDPSMAHNIPAVFRSSIASATAIARLLRALQATDEIKYLPPFAVQHILRCALVHGLNCLAIEESGGQRASSGNFWLCFRVLGELSIVWKELSEGTMPFALMATRNWGFQQDVVSGIGEADKEKYSADDGYDDVDYGTGLGMSDDFFEAGGITDFVL